jgi:hypothetical protein
VVHPSPKGDFSLKPFDEHRCIFIHTTKTAGTTVAQGLFGYLPYHYTAVDYRVIFGKRDFNRYFKFAFVRNPWDRLYSAFRYLKAGGWDKKDAAWAADHLSEFDDFNVFVKQWLCEANIQKHRHFWPQHRFICDRSGTLLVDYLGYFETLEQDVQMVGNRLGISVSLGIHNTNPGPSYLQAYDTEARHVVAHVYAQDIALLGYGFRGIDRRRIIPRTCA